jgi:hypothetical protein
MEEEDGRRVRQRGGTNSPEPLDPPPTKSIKKIKRAMKKMSSQLAGDSGDMLQAIHPDDIITTMTKVTWDDDPELLCSYNWEGVEDDYNTLFVPGGLPIWAPQKLPYTLKEASGWTYKSYNYVRDPKEPYTPMFEALRVMKPDFNLSEVDILADRHSLRDLLKFVQGKKEPLCMSVHLVKETIILGRSYDMNLQKAVGYGHSFEKTFTCPDPDMGEAEIINHYRAIRYALGPLNAVVRFEADARYIEDAEELSPQEDTDDNVMLKLKRPYSYSDAPVAPYQVFKRGRMVLQYEVAELKTKTFKSKGQKLPTCKDQLWFGRTEHLFTGYYEPGTGILNPGMARYDDMREKVAEWEESQQKNLQKLVGLITELREILRNKTGEKKAAIIFRDKEYGPLYVCERLVNDPIVGRKYVEEFWK